MHHERGPESHENYINGFTEKILWGPKWCMAITMSPLQIIFSKFCTIKEVKSYINEFSKKSLTWGIWAIWDWNMTCHHNSGSAQMIFLKTLHNGSSQEVHENYIVFSSSKWCMAITHLLFRFFENFARSKRPIGTSKLHWSFFQRKNWFIAIEPFWAENDMLS